MTLTMTAVCERVRLVIGAVSVVLFTLVCGRSMVGNLDRVRHAIVSSGLAWDSGGIIMAGGFGMTTLGGKAGGWSSWGRRIGCRIERGWMRVRESFVQCGFVCAGLVVLSIVGWPGGAPLSQKVDCRMRCEDHHVRRM